MVKAGDLIKQNLDGWGVSNYVSGAIMAQAA